jgi:hypothetical protein
VFVCSADLVVGVSTVVRLLQKYQRLEYRGDWHAQFHKAEIVGAPGHGVPVAFFEAEEGEIA